MKFWRRHKHEFSADETAEPLPVAPEKKMRYSREDDILLARYFFEKPEGTSDKIFQNFGRLFHQNGYLLVPGFLDTNETEALLGRAKQLLDEFSLDDHPLTKFTTSDKDHVGDDYFLNSADKIRYFLEEDAVDENGKLTRDKSKAVNKIGHALHELDPIFRKVTLENEKLRRLVRDLKFHREPVALQSMVITKQTHIGGQVPEHNDSTFLYTDPPSALGFWIALEKCTPANGALSFLPGSHLTSPITKRFVRLPEGGTGFEELIPPEVELPLHTGKYVLEACNPGDLVLIHGSVLPVPCIKSKVA
ncbi:hypothetical protein C0991_005045 [Blastosporella zonata]|nr:hypothetical protein C0991_005045 [Blastosporella zonata]